MKPELSVGDRKIDKVVVSMPEKNLDVSGPRVEPILETAFNAVALDRNKFTFVARELQSVGKAADYTSNGIYTFNAETGDYVRTGEFNPRRLGVTSELNDPRKKFTNFEDLRIVTNGKDLEEGGEAVLGCTAVSERDVIQVNSQGEATIGFQSWHPAILTAKMGENGLEATSELHVFDQMKGKNMTPVHFDKDSGKVELLVRRDDDGYGHNDLQRCSYDIKTRQLKELQTITIPTLEDFNTGGGGTVGAPVTVDGRELLFVHGRVEYKLGSGEPKSEKEEAKERKRIVYKLGVVEIDREKNGDWKIKNGKVAQIMDRSDIQDKSELRPEGSEGDEKVVIYSPDNPILAKDADEKESIHLAVSYGDVKTAIAKFPVESIFAKLDGKPEQKAPSLSQAAI